MHLRAYLLFMWVLHIKGLKCASSVHQSLQLHCMVPCLIH